MRNVASAISVARPAQATTMTVPLAMINIGTAIHHSGAIRAQITASYARATSTAPRATKGSS